ncbi:hypothetical protein [Pseudomaricurvus sp. HS19]|uniref:hypothetical protein n=1 Tax=Pseudomaricurvus sp. HS19 TaxID=2692626 RepID=UPI001368A7E9|nr:hypothetical protein [Pseudomaricurvus sp. HS19]MYM62284.1 hypothetical protein [Pseudomaricurvus sp. HS19]
MKSFNEVNHWARRFPLIPVHVDCAIAVMLKILDGKCKMKPEEKVVMTHLYHAVKNRPSRLLGGEMHSLISRAEETRDRDLLDAIYEQRVLAETMISRPVMKTFKSLIRQQGLFESAVVQVEEEEHWVDDLVAEFV